MFHRFSIGSLVRHKETNEDAKVLRTFVQSGIPMYEVKIPVDQTSWQMGTKVVTEWKDSDLVASQNEGLKY